MYERGGVSLLLIHGHSEFGIIVSLTTSSHFEQSAGCLERFRALWLVS